MSSSSLFLIALCALFSSTLLNAAEATSVRWTRAIESDNTAVISEILDSLESKGVTDAKKDLTTVASASGKSALMIACKTGDLDLVERLLERGADVHRRTQTGGSTMMYASLGNHVQVAKRLLQHAVDINAQGSNGWSATTIAAAKGFTEMLTFLLANGVDANLLDVYQWSPLMRAVDNRHYAAVKVLLAEKEIALNTQSDTGNTALHIAAANGDEKMLALLLDAGSDQSLLNTQGTLAVQLVAGLPNGDKLTSLFASD